MTIAEQFSRYSDWVADKSPLYAELTEATADDGRLLDIAAEASDGQPEPELLLAAVHSLLLEGRDHPLAQFYPTCDQAESDGNPVPYFRDFCLTNEGQLRFVIANRRCQTNDVGRSAVLLPAFERVARTAEQDTLAQIEIGTSAGLNLNWDRYRYDFVGVDRFGEVDSPVTITTEACGERHPPLSREFPQVTHRCGIDLSTLDVTNEEDVRWLRALIHPNQVRRHRQLTAAIEVAQGDQPTLLEGDAVERLPEQLSAAPNDAALVVFSTHVLYQFDEDTIAELRSLLSEYSSEQPVHWLSIDPGEELGEPTYRLVTFTDGNAAESQIARFDPYGEWVRWLDE